MCDVTFVELNACSGGCVGGVMNVVNPFIAKARMHTLRHYLPVSQNWADDSTDSLFIPEEYLSGDYGYEPVSALHGDRAKAFDMMAQIEALRAKLPNLDCGFCGAPTCSAFASDVIRGEACIEECIALHVQKGDTQ